LDHKADSHEFHVFGAASGKAIAACMYSVPIKNGMRLKPRLIGGVMKIVNAKQQERNERSTEKFAIKHADDSLQVYAPAINRLELSAATMALSFAENVLCLLNEKDKTSVTYWTDSENFLRQINKGWNFSLTTRYNQKRVDKILSMRKPEQWRHVDGKRNPADIASRETPRAQESLASSLWLLGPEFLTQEESNWPERKEDLSFQKFSGPDFIQLTANIGEETMETDKTPSDPPRLVPTTNKNEVMGRTWKESCRKAKTLIKEYASSHPQWEAVNNLLSQPIDKQNLLEIFLVWIAQKQHCSELYQALKTKRVPTKFENIVKFHNLQIVSIEELANIHLIVSKSRDIKRTNKRVKMLRRQNLPNVKVSRRQFKTQGLMDKLVDTLKQLESGDMLIFVPPKSTAVNLLVRHYHEEVTAHGSLQMVEIMIQKYWLVLKLTRVCSWAPVNEV
jgi:ribonuclease HI